MNEVFHHVPSPIKVSVEHKHRLALTPAVISLIVAFILGAFFVITLCVIEAKL